uniref:magnesium-protoporphyrin IX monomethyl ester (oxidative) cyclase n=2 Tax=Oryza TaxID=4527 RepID=A0A0E0C0S8_9ORYZ
MASSAMELSLLNPAAMRGLAAASAAAKPRVVSSRRVVRFRVAASAAAPPAAKPGAPKKRGKTEIQETLLTPRFYTTDFDEMERLFNAEINKQLNQEEFDALLQEFKTDYNQTHFVRNPEFKAAADKMEGPLRQIFVEFLERSCTAEFSGFLLYKELGRRLKKTNPVVAEIFSLMSRDEARHAGFLNKGLSDFNLALDLGFLTKARKYTFFKPKFIFYATYLSEKIGYWRYITIFRHLKANPEYQVYPIFKYFENWCQDENRHGDFFSALLKAQPQFLNDWKAKLWSRFFCLSVISELFHCLHGPTVHTEDCYCVPVLTVFVCDLLQVYVTMYLNDCQRTTFYEGIGLDTKEFDMHVIIETNRTTARIFPAVLDVENPEFKRKLDRMVEINKKIIAIGESDDIPLVKNLKRIPHVAALVSEIIAAYLMPPIESGSVDFAEFEPQLVY